MTPEQAARRWRERRTAQARRDVELETFPTTAGAQSKVSHPMFGTGRPASPARARLPGLVTEPPAPAGLTSWGTWEGSAIEHVGGGYHLLACNLISQDEGWFEDGFYVRWAIAVWLIRPDGSISDPWVSPGNITRPTTSGPDFDATQAPPYGEPTELCMPKLARWQEGALLAFTSYLTDRPYVDDLASFWPQVEGSSFDFNFGVPSDASVYRWIGHDGTDPVVGPAFELYAGPDDDFPTSGDWDVGGGVTEFDDAIVEGHEVIGPSADPNIAVYGLAANSSRHRVWILEKDPADNSLALAQRTTFTSGQADGNPGGLTRVAADRWVSMSSTADRMKAVLFDAKTGTVVDASDFDIVPGYEPGPSDFVDCYFGASLWGYHAGNHLHFDGQAVFATWYLRLIDNDDLEHRHTTISFAGDTLSIDDPTTWDTTDADVFGLMPNQISERLVETCEGCLRLILTAGERNQALFERRRHKAGISPLPSPELDDGSGVFNDYRRTPSSHPAGYMWASNSTLPGLAPLIPQLIRYPA